MLGFPSRNRKSSSGSIPKVDLTESPQEKARYKINTKADPSKAISEAEPGTFPPLLPISSEQRLNRSSIASSIGRYGHHSWYPQP